MAVALLQAEGLKKYYPVTKGLLFGKTVGAVKAVDGISFSVSAGETFGLVGESGCGKTTTAKLMLLLESASGGDLYFKGKEFRTLSTSEIIHYRASVQAVFQDPFSSLNPRMTVDKIVAEPLVANTHMTKIELRERIAALLAQVGLPADSASLYPHEFSGGQRQRIAVARALALNPDLVILDEPVSSLDVCVGAQMMNLLRDLQQSLHLAYVLIAHNLATVRYLCSSVAVMYLGKIVEAAACEDLFSNALHPYTKALLAAALPCDPRVERQEMVLKGEVPSAINVPAGCRFHPRCPEAIPPCAEVEPGLLSPDHSGHLVACHLFVST